MKRGQLFVVGALLGGCTVMVNGKPRRIGGGPDPAPQAAQGQAQGQGQGQGQAQPKPDPREQPAAPKPPPAAATVVAVEPGLGRDPLVVPVTAAFDTSWSKVFGRGSNSPNCGSDIPSAPIASFEVRQPDSELTVSVVGGGNDGFVVRKGESYWTACTQTISQVPTMGPVKGGWQPGRYDIYPVSRYGRGGAPQSFQVELYRPGAPAASLDKVQPLVISAKLDRPLFIEVTTRPGRRVLREAHAGYGCEKIALSATPDLALTIERPIPGLTIRPLPSEVPVTLRREGMAEMAEKFRKGCIKGGGRRGHDAPSYVAPSELRFDRDEGTYAISIGTPDAAAETKVTLMVFDDSTKLDPLAVRPFGGEQPTLEQRWIGYQLPQLDIGELGAARGWAHAEHTARVFAAVPRQALVYAKLDWDKDLAGGDHAAYPVKNEPLAVLGVERERVTVLTADGFRFTVKQSHVRLEPDGPIAIPAAPRPGRKLGIGDAIAMLPPSAKKLGDAHRQRVEAREKCRDRAWAPYGRQLPTISRPSNVDIVVVKNARYRQIEEAGEAAMDRQCGTDRAFEQQTEATRVKLMAEVEKGRAKLLADATAHLR